jgi:katanin p80 WD40 repeat-containing subunit B1
VLCDPTTQKPLTGQSKKELGDDEAMMLLRGGHEVLMNVLVSRHRNLQVVKAMWSAGNVRVSCAA